MARVTRTRVQHMRKTSLKTHKFKIHKNLTTFSLGTNWTCSTGSFIFRAIFCRMDPTLSLLCALSTRTATLVTFFISTYDANHSLTIKAELSYLRTSPLTHFYNKHVLKVSRKPKQPAVKVLNSKT